MAWLREHGSRSASSRTRPPTPGRTCAATLADAGFDVGADEIITAVVATASYLRTNLPRRAGRSCCPTVTAAATSTASTWSRRRKTADVMVIGGACDDFSYDIVNRVFRRLRGRRRAGRDASQPVLATTAEDWELDGGAYSQDSRPPPASPPRSAASRRPPTSTPRCRCGRARRTGAHGGRRHRERHRRRAGRRASPACWCGPGSSARIDLERGDAGPRRSIRSPTSPHSCEADRSWLRPTVGRRPAIFTGDRSAVLVDGCGDVVRPGRPVATVHGVERERRSPGRWCSTSRPERGWCHANSPPANGCAWSRSTPASRCCARGSRRTRLAGLDAQITPVLGRAERLPFPDETFDALTFTYLFRYVDDPAATMRELARVVRPGGSIAIAGVPRARTAVAAGRLVRVHARRAAGDRVAGGTRVARDRPVPRAQHRAGSTSVRRCRSRFAGGRKPG